MRLQQKSIIPIRIRWDIGAIIAWCPVLFYLANLFRMTGHSSLPYIFALAACGFLGLAVLIFSDIARPEILLFTLLLFAITGLLNAIIIGNSDIFEIASNMLYIGIMIVMLAFPMTYAQSAVFFYVGISVFLLGAATGTQTTTFLTSSGNYISVLIILIASIYYITIQNTDHRFSAIDLLPAILCFGISVWAKGRAGILSCLFMLALLLAFYAYNYASKGSMRFLIIAAFFLFFCGIIVINNIKILETIFGLGKLSTRGLDNSAREMIWGAYFDKVKESIVYLLGGAPLRDVIIIRNLNNNTHNSFIQLHACNGLIAIVSFAIISFKTLVSYVKRKQFIYAIVLMTILLRGMTDKFIFGQYGMPITIFLVLEPYYYTYIRNRYEKIYSC